jgi:hypothetical protein
MITQGRSLCADFDARRNVLAITRIGFIIAVFLASLAVATIARAQNNPTASADDTARFLAGLPPSANSPLLQLSQDPAAQQHAAAFDAAFGNFEKNQLAKIRAWASANPSALPR